MSLGLDIFFCNLISLYQQKATTSLQMNFIFTRWLSFFDISTFVLCMYESITFSIQQKAATCIMKASWKLLSNRIFVLMHVNFPHLIFSRVTTNWETFKLTLIYHFEFFYLDSIDRMSYRQKHVALTYTFVCDLLISANKHSREIFETTIHALKIIYFRKWICFKCFSKLHYAHWIIKASIKDEEQKIITWWQKIYVQCM